MEEAYKFLKQKIYDFEQYINAMESYPEDYDENIYNDYVEELKEYKNILNELERLQKEYERLKEKHKITCELNVGLLENMKECIPKQVIRDKIKELSKYRDLAKELIEHKIVVADSDSLNYGRAEAHYKDIQVLKELLGE